MSSELSEQIVSVDTEKKEYKENSLLSRYNPLRVILEDNDLILFTKQFASLTSEKFSIVEALNTLSTKINNEHLKAIILESIPEIKSGIPLHICFRRHNDVFEELYCDLIKIGEESGRIDKVLERLTTLLEKRVEIGKEVNRCIDYFSRILVYSITEILFLMTLIVPYFDLLLEKLNKTTLSIFVLNTGFWFQSHIIYILSFLFGVTLLYYLANLTKRGRYFLDFLKLKIPVFGNLIKKYLMILYSRNMVAMYNSGITFISSMKICNKSLSNIFLKNYLEKIADDLEKGIPITEAFFKSNNISERTLSIIERGEESGYIDEIFSEIAEKYEKEVYSIIMRIDTLTKPFFFVIMFVICSLVVVGLCVPLYSAFIKTLLLK